MALIFQLVLTSSFYYMTLNSRRNIFIFKNSLATGFARFIGIFLSYASLPITIKYLGIEEFGVWTTISCFIALFQLVDLGISNALIGISAREFSKSGIDNIKSLYLSGLAVLLPFSLLMIIALSFLIQNFSVIWMFNSIDRELALKAEDCAYMFIFLFAINIPLTVSQQLRMGVQDGVKNSYFNSFGYFLNFLGLLVTVKVGAGILALTFFSMAGTVLSNALNSFSMYLSLKNKKINFYKAWHYLKEVLLRGRSFLILQITVLLSYNLDNLIIAKNLGPQDVVLYSTTLKIFSIPSFFLSLLFTSLWAVYPEALEKKDWAWISSTFKNAVIYGSFFSFILALALFLMGPLLMDLLSHGLIAADKKLMLLMSFWACFSAIGGATASFLNGLHIMKQQAFLAILSTVINFLLSIFLVKKIGIYGPIIGTIVAQLVIYPRLILICFNRINTEKLTIK